MSDKEQKRLFSNNLSRLLNERQKSQKEVADAIGVSPQTFNTWIQGIAILRMDKIQLLADYFNIRKTILIDPLEESAEKVISFSSEEESIILAYRKAPDLTKDAVANVLGVKRAGSGSGSAINNVG